MKKYEEEGNEYDIIDFHKINFQNHYKIYFKKMYTSIYFYTLNLKTFIYCFEKHRILF